MYQMERSRSMHPSPDQVYTLLEVMEINPLLAKGHVKSVMARQTATRHWHHLAIKLNNMGGATKTGKQWAKYWSDKKSAVKKKAIVRLTAIKQGSDSEQILELSDVEERIITLMGGEKFVVPETPKHAAINDSYKDPPGRVPDEDRDTQQANVEINNHSSRISEDGDSRQTTMVYQHPETIDDQSNRTSNVSLSTTIADPLGDPLRPSSNMSASHFSSTLRTDESKPALDSVRSASHIRNRRPFYLTSAPTRSRRSFIRNLTEGLLRVEEQRLEMERENAQWNQKRDRMLIETFSGVCESLNASLNCLNKLTSLLTESIKKE